MPLDVEQLHAVRIILRAIHEECRTVPLGNLLEGHVKVVAVNALLLQDHAILEGAGRRGVGRLVRIENGRLIQSLDRLPDMAPRKGSEKARLSPDIRVRAPCKLVVEIQIRTQFGSQATLFSDNLADDLDRVRRGVADVLLFVADRPIYESLRGLKADSRGRKAKHTEVFLATLPQPDSLPGHVGDMGAPREQSEFGYIGSCAESTFGVQHVVLALWSAQTPPRNIMSAETPNPNAC